MKQLIIIATVIIALVSCTEKETKMHGYVVSLSYPSTKIINGKTTNSEVKMSIDYVGEFNNDSIINVYVERQSAERTKYMDKQLKEYYSIKPKKASTKEEKVVAEVWADVQKSALRSRIGEWKFMVVISDSLLNTVGGNYEEIIKNRDKSYSNLIQLYDIYDGTELASELDLAYIENWHRKHSKYDYLYY